MVLLRWPRITSPAVSFRERYNSVIAQYSKLQKAMFMLHPFPYMAADAVPIWRAYVLWPHSRKAKALLITVCGLNMVFCVTRSILEYIVFEFPRLHKMAPFLYPAQLAFSTITNGVVTIAIGIRAWHHRELTKDLRRTSSNPVYILLVLVEAGAFLCITQTLNLIMAFLGFFLGASLTSPYLLTGMVFSIFGDTVAAAYPALIVIVLSFRGSMLERTHQGLTGTLYRSEGGVVEMQQGREGRLTTIQFAASGGQSIDSRTRSNSDNSENHRMKKEGD
ncbi:hypothetical protein DL96DRAFT_1620545 [Flagelloscypha sp. PMI_526]|nr:hypothetical protein DL96DRAFT_1620545 [Flagelloscypha sp. PMI_526]